MCEAQMHRRLSFITLTYAPEHVPDPGTGGLQKDHFQLFVKRLREWRSRQQASGKGSEVNGVASELKLFYCGEYGEKNWRPHFHAVLFGEDFKDRILHTVRNGNPLYRSPSLEKLWRYGYSSVGEVTFESAAYVARYVTKKITGPMADLHYMDVDPSTGEYLGQLEPEYCKMSLNKGIGYTWFQRYWRDVYPNDYLVIRGGIKMRPPRYFDKLLERQFPDVYAQVKQARLDRPQLDDDEQSDQRLRVKERVAEARLKRLVRTLESETT